jgi:hypothetical protein
VGAPVFAGCPSDLLPALQAYYTALAADYTRNNQQYGDLATTASVELSTVSGSVFDSLDEVPSTACVFAITGTDSGSGGGDSVPSTLEAVWQNNDAECPGDNNAAALEVLDAVQQSWGDVVSPDGRYKVITAGHANSTREVSELLHIAGLAGDWQVADQGLDTVGQLPDHDFVSYESCWVHLALFPLD